ncbi:MAG: glycosyltransferase family 4 protein, partial [Candidatus Aenigmatarchaeota archaeon]
MVRKEDVDLIHSHNCSDLLVPKKVPIINTAHNPLKLEVGVMADENRRNISQEDFLIRMFGRVAQIFEGRCYRRSDRLIAVSRYTERLLRMYDIGEVDVDVIYNGVNTEKYRPMETDLKEKLGVENIVLYLGRLSKRKGVQRLIRNADRIFEEHGDTKIL